MNAENGRQFLQALYREVWCAQDASKIEKFYSKELTGFVDQQTVTYDDIALSLDYMKKNVKALDCTIADVVAENNKVFGVVNLKGTPFDGEQWFSSLALCVELIEGKIRRMRLFSSITQTVAAKNVGAPVA